MLVFIVSIILALCNAEKPTLNLAQIEGLFCSNSSQSCPLWSTCNESEKSCECIDLPGNVLQCNGGTSQLIKSVLILDCYCATYREE